MRGIDIKRIGAGLAAVAFVLASSLGVVANAAAEGDVCDNESSDFNYYACRLVDFEGVPDGLTLVAQGIDYDTYDDEDFSVAIFGTDYETAFAELEEIEDKYEDEGDEYKKAIMGFYDRLGLLPWEGAVDIHLERDGDKVEYSGDSITVKYGFGENPITVEWFAEWLAFSEKEWETVVIHIDENMGGVKYLPAEVDDDGVWTFATTDFSFFFPALKVVEEEEAPKTGDGVLATIAMFGALSVAGAVICARMAARR